MKIYALLLGLFVLFLSVKSVVEPVAFLKEVDACCKDKGSDPKNSDTEKDGCTDLCSPFQPCCPYVAFSTAVIKVEQPKPLRLVEKGFPIYDVKFVSKYTSDFWQPPKKA